MTPQERQLVDDLFDRLSKLESAPRDPDAIAAISDGLRKAPSAVYALVQTVLLQDEALKRANSRIQELEGGGAGEQHPAGGFLDSMRETVFGQNPQRGSVPNVRPPDLPGRPVWNSGQVMQQTQPPGQYDQGPYNQPYGQPYGAPQGPGGLMGGGLMGGGGGSFLGTAAAAAAGMVGGSLLLGSIRSMMGGNRHGFGDAAGLGSTGSGDKAVSDQSNSDLARDAGINNIGSSGNRADDNSRAGLFDTASNDDDHDDMDLDADDFGGDGDSDYA
jgi:hypothetical protein